MKDTGTAVRNIRTAVLLPALALALAAGLASGLAGCAKMDAALSKQTAEISFAPGTSVATELKVRAACAHIQNAPPLPLPAQRTVLNMVGAVEYNVTSASDANVAELESCLGKFRSVQGVTMQDAADDGS